VKKRIQVQASTDSTAEPGELYALLANSATYPLWSMIRYYESLRAGRDGLHSVGALRLFRTNRITVMREEVTELVPNERVGYRLLSGFPLMEYRSETTLEKVPLGTRITWVSSFYPKYALTGWFWRGLMAWVLKSLVQSLAKAAEDSDRRSKILSLAHGQLTMTKNSVSGTSRSARPA
jgi:hypothetical protein